MSTASYPARPPARKNRRTLWLIAGTLLAIVSTWIAVDLFTQPRTSLRAFDSQEVTRLETAMWRSYYDKERVKLFGQLAELLRTQYRLPFVRSNLVAYQAAKAAFVFKQGHNRSEYEKALPNLVNYYAAIREVSDTPFTVEQAAELELEWWIIHRERQQHTPADLVKSLAELPAAIYQIPVEKFTEHAKLRAEAMTLRDDKAAAGGVSETDWQKIDQLLQESWRSLWQAVNTKS